MSKFWFKMWSYWALWLSLFSLLLATLLTLIPSALHFFKSDASLNMQTLGALGDIFVFYFAIMWSFSFVLGLLLSIKRIFKHCIASKRFKLLSCDGKSEIDAPELFEHTKLFRKWFFAMIWMIAVEMILISLLSYLFAEGTFSWFNIYYLYLLVLSAGALVLPLLGRRCTMLKLRTC